MTTAPAPTASLIVPTNPIVIGHRGASGCRPEHTLASYSLAIRQGVDYIEPDLVSTKDGVLVARHENEIGGTTDVAEHAEFADRRATKPIDGREVTGWFTEDFTLEELKTLRAKERLPEVRPGNTRYDGKFTVPTLDEVLRLAQTASKRTGRSIGVYPETKHPTYFASIGLSLEVPLLRTLRRHRMDRRWSGVIIQSFETENLWQLSRVTRVPLVQLIDATGDLATPEGLAEIATYADGIGAHKDLVLPRDPASGAIGEPTALVDDAHREDLAVHVWTLRAENRFLPTGLRRGNDPNAAGDLRAEAQAFLDAGVDGIFSDHPGVVVGALGEWLERDEAS